MSSRIELVLFACLELGSLSAFLQPQVMFCEACTVSDLFSTIIRLGGIFCLDVGWWSAGA